MTTSLERVKAAAVQAGVTVDIIEMPASTRTAVEAANACGCDVAQIVKSLIFQGKKSRTLKLLLVSGKNRVDLAKAAHAVGEPLAQADPDLVREKTGFAIGGVAPIGHICSLDCFIDHDLLALDIVWAAAGTPNAVFSITPQKLIDVTQGQIADLAEPA